MLTFVGYSSKIQDFPAYVSRKLAADVRDVLPKNTAEFDRYKDTIIRALASAEKLGFNYHKPNVFISSEDELKTSNGPKTFEDSMKPTAAPKIIKNDGENGKWMVFFKQDD